MEMRCYRISYKDCVTDEEVRATVQQAIRTKRRSSDHRKETQTSVVCSCLPFIRSGKNHLARHSERGKKTDRGRGGKTTSGNGKAWTSPSPRGQLTFALTSGTLQQSNRTTIGQQLKLQVPYSRTSVRLGSFFHSTIRLRILRSAVKFCFD